jgi:hypothetical protein
MPRKSNGQRKNKGTVATTAQGSGALAKRKETPEEIRKREEMEEEQRRVREDKELAKTERAKETKKKHLQYKAVRQVCRDVFRLKYGQKYKKPDESQIRADFSAHIKNSKEKLLFAEENLKQIKSTLITHFDDIDKPYTDKGEDKENIKLILEHVNDLYELMVKYETNKTDDMARKIIHHIRHIQEKLRINFALYYSSELPGDQSDIYKESCSVQPKGRPLIRHFTINDDNFGEDREKYFSACENFTSIATNEILSKMTNVMKSAVPERNFDEWKETIKEKNDLIQSRKEQQKDNKAKTIERKRERAESQRAITGGKFDQKEERQLPGAAGTGATYELSTQDLLTQMRSMRLSM